MHVIRRSLLLRMCVDASLIENLAERRVNQLEINC